MAWVRISTAFRFKNKGYPVLKKAQDIPDDAAELAEKEGWAVKARPPVKNKMVKAPKNK